jgi:AAA+ superfamily predicted ATPase
MKIPPPLLNTTEMTRKPVLMVDSIYQKVVKSTLSISNIPLDDPDINELSSILNTTPFETVFFAVVVVLNLESRRTSVVELAKTLKLSAIQTISLIGNLEPLVSNKLLVIIKPKRTESYQSEIKFAVPSVVMDFILYNIPIKQKTEEISVFDFLVEVEFVLGEKEHGTHSHEEFLDKMEDLLVQRQDMLYVKNLEQLNLDQQSKLIVLALSVLTVTGKVPIEIDDLLKEITTSFVSARRLKKDIAEGKNTLTTKGILKLEEAQFRTDISVTLSDKAIKMLFGKDDADLILIKNTESANLISPDKIEEVQLFFNDDITGRIDTLSKILTDEGLKNVQSKLKKNSLHTGVCCIIYGEPGTGKTEIVKQLAKKTGRPLLMLEVADIKSMWYGESETKLKQFFTNYKMLVRNSEVCPILMLNECDQLLSSRVNVKRTVDQTSNALQNILLNEIENLEGVLIATTNRIDSLDSAFMRRFLYKIKMDKPTLETRKKILKNKMNFLTDRQVEVLAEKFPDLTGGQIENITRKYFMNMVLYETPTKLSEIEEYAAEEQIGARNKLGFNR